MPAEHGRRQIAGGVVEKAVAAQVIVDFLARGVLENQMFLLIR